MSRTKSPFKAFTDECCHSINIDTEILFRNGDVEHLATSEVVMICARIIRCANAILSAKVKAQMDEETQSELQLEDNG